MRMTNAIVNSRLLGRIQLQPADSDGLPSLHGNIDARLESSLPGLQEAVVDGTILLNSGGGNLLPSLGIESECPAELITVSSALCKSIGSGGRGSEST